jgi:hypothetical protein
MAGRILTAAQLRVFAADVQPSDKSVVFLGLSGGELAAEDQVCIGLDVKTCVQLHEALMLWLAKTVPVTPGGAVH